MSLYIAIDGYNLIGASSGMDMSQRDLEGTRNELLNRLAAYKRNKTSNGPLKITVVFDGTMSGYLSRSQGVYEGIEVVFSRNGELADSVLKEMARKRREGLTLITSDRDIVDYATAHGTVVVSSEEFNGRLEMAMYAEVKGIDMEEDAGFEDTGKKKGPARRLSKIERRKMRRLKKL